MYGVHLRVYVYLCSFHPPLIYGRRGNPEVEESEGIAVCRVEKKSSKQSVFCLITYTYPTLSARAVPQLKDFCENYRTCVGCSNRRWVSCDT